MKIRIVAVSLSVEGENVEQVLGAVVAGLGALVRGQATPAPELVRRRLYLWMKRKPKAGDQASQRGVQHAFFEGVGLCAATRMKPGEKGHAWGPVREMIPTETGADGLPSSGHVCRTCRDRVRRGQGPTKR